jgi:uncharacterized membrane protein SirB2
MGWYTALKHSHMSLVVLSVILFNLRFFWRQIYPTKVLRRGIRIAPHIIDTLLLVTGVSVAIGLQLIPFFPQQWLGVKIVLLVFYIGFGMYAMKSSARGFQAIYSYLLAMLTIFLMAWLAVSKPILWT